jgi:phospho-N-acetylmuramoyl-pentapeptide-transferase
MFYHLLYQALSSNYSFLNVFQYQTFRAMGAFLFTFAFVLFFEPLFIKKLQTLGVQGQPIRDDGPKDHELKRGTPTMGGLIIVAAVIMAALLFCDLTNKYVWLTLGVMTASAYVGFIDDWRKITKQDSKGLSEQQKIIWQIIIAGVAGVILWATPFPHDLTLPFFKNLMIPLGVFFVPFVVIVVIGTSNAVNLTDGLDGLAIGPAMSVACLYALFAYLTGNVKIASYLHLIHVVGVGEISIILAAVFAGGLGFLWYNTFPAQVFMGDTGALALGAILGFSAVLVKQELLLVVAGGIFVVEAMSVLIQRYYYKLTKKRVFKMAPIHHHYELKGWAEPKIIVRFWIISIVLAIISLSTLKLR